MESKLYKISLKVEHDQKRIIDEYKIFGWELVDKKISGEFIEILFQRDEAILSEEDIKLEEEYFELENEFFLTLRRLSKRKDNDGHIISKILILFICISFNLIFFGTTLFILPFGNFPAEEIFYTLNLVVISILFSSYLFYVLIIYPNKKIVSLSNELKYIRNKQKSIKITIIKQKDV